jgi:orotate phosphoribosyltransferase
MIADRLDLEFYFSARIDRESGKTLYSARYEIPVGVRGNLAGKRVAIVDDVINAGSAVRATLVALQNCGAQPVAIASLLVLGAAGPSFFAERQVPLERIAWLPNSLWTPTEARCAPLICRSTTLLMCREEVHSQSPAAAKRAAVGGEDVFPSAG